MPTLLAHLAAQDANLAGVSLLARQALYVSRTDLELGQSKALAVEGSVTFDAACVRDAIEAGQRGKVRVCLTSDRLEVGSLEVAKQSGGRNRPVCDRRDQSIEPKLRQARDGRGVGAPAVEDHRKLEPLAEPFA